MSVRPIPSLYSSRIFEALKARTAARADRRVSLFMEACILDSGTMTKEQWALAAAVGTMVAWGMNFAFVKYILDNLGVGAFMFLRFSVLPLLGFALLAIMFRGRLPRSYPEPSRLPLFALFPALRPLRHMRAVEYCLQPPSQI